MDGECVGFGTSVFSFFDESSVDDDDYDTEFMHHDADIHGQIKKGLGKMNKEPRRRVSTP